MKNYYRVMLGRKSAYADECFKGNFIGADFGIQTNLANNLSEWKDFNKKYMAIYQKNFPNKSKIAAGLATGALWTVSKGVQVGDIVLSPNEKGSYMIGEIIGDYEYQPGQILPHRRPTRWYSRTIEKSIMSTALRSSSGGQGTVRQITHHAEEIERLIEGSTASVVVTADETIEDPTVFALEKHLEDFLIQNWKQTELGKRYDIYEEDGEPVGQQYLTDTGYIDILAISKDRKELLVVELKKGRVSDIVVGQIQRYMGYVMETLAEKGQSVKGVIIGLEDDIRIRRALSVARNIEFYRYQVSFKLFKG
jgi:restriction system protein